MAQREGGKPPFGVVLLNFFKTVYENSKIETIKAIKTQEKIGETPKDPDFQEEDVPMKWLRGEQ